MNVSQIVTRGLNKANLSVTDIAFRDFAADTLDEIIQEIWESKHWQFRKKSFTLATADSTEEYALDILALVQSIIPKSMRGSDPIRVIDYKPATEFFRTNFASDSGNPYRFREGTLQGFQNNP